MKCLTALLLALPLISWPLTSLAQPKPVEEMSLLQVVTPLLLVIILIFVLAWLVKKLNPGGTVLGQGIKVIASAPLSGQARVCLVKVGDKDILLGVTGQKVSLLHTFEQPVNLPSTQPSANLAEQFSRLLKKEKTRI